MGTSDHIDPPFGQYALPPNREARRFGAHRLGDDRLGRWTISLRRKQAIRGLSEPFDVTVAPSVKARLYPSTNRCEKRALCGVQIWDAAEREALRKAILKATAQDFIFLDVGANVGLYSLFANSYAQEANRNIRLIAVEPSAEMGARLTVNAKASEAPIELIRSAIATEVGEVFLTLLQLCAQAEVDHIDTLKLDIEGHDFPVLTQFFEQAPVSLHPKMMILELDETSAAPLIELTQAHDYLIITRTRMNVVVAKRDS